jgi:protein TonB
VRRRESERGVFAVALGAALALHLVALVMPLPERPVAEPPKPKPPRGPVITKTDLPPPELPELPAAPAAPAPRPTPVPMQEAPLPDPVSEPTPLLSFDELGESPVEFADFDPGPPPPAPDLMEEGTPGLTPPRLITKCSDPLYPRLAIKARVEGVVRLRAVITVRGDVTSIELLSAPRPDLGFSESAIAAVSCWKYEPGRYGGRPVAVSMSVFVQFELD